MQWNNHIFFILHPLLCNANLFVLQSYLVRTMNIKMRVIYSIIIEFGCIIFSFLVIEKMHVIVAIATHITARDGSRHKRQQTESVDVQAL